MKESINIYEEKRPWGNFRKFTENANSTVKIINVLPNKKLSLQKHTKRSEFWRVIKGNGYFIIGESREFVEVGSETTVPKGAIHRIEAGNEGLIVLEIAIGEFDENDIIRIEDDYNRI